MNTDNFDLLVEQYQETAGKLRERATELKAKRATEPYDLQKRYEERIAILEAEYGHLLKIASYMRANYAETKSCEGETKCATQSA